MFQADAEVHTECLYGVCVILDKGKKIFLCYKCVCAWSPTFSKGGVMWRLNIVDSKQGHLTAACDLRDIVYTFLLTCQHTNKAYLFSATRRT